MPKQQYINIIEHQAELRCQNKGLIFSSLSQKEQYKLKYEIALELLEEIGK